MKLSIGSIVLSIICIVITLWINHKMAIDYLEADGKTKAFFSMISLTSFGYRYYFSSIGVVGIVLAVISFYKKKNLTALVAIVLSAAAITLTFLDLWRIWI